MTSIIIVDSSEDEGENDSKDPLSTPADISEKQSNTPATTRPLLSTIKKPVNNITAKKRKPSNNSSSAESTSTLEQQPRKRIKPTQISTTVDKTSPGFQSPSLSILPDWLTNPMENPLYSPTSEDLISGSPSVSSKAPDEGNTTQADSPQPSTSPSLTDRQLPHEMGEGNPLNPAFETLLETCRKADPSPDMEILIQKKLLKYYHTVHPDFVSSKGFTKTIKAVIEEIDATPQLVYYKLKTIVEELKTRRKSRETVMSNEDSTTTGNERKDYQIKRLSRALYILTKRISKLEETDVDWNDDDNSAYLQVEKCKKRACEIYEKICDLTGESKHAHRSVKKPISFNETCYPEFNRTIQAFVNRTNTFPDFFDVLRCLEHCNKQYGFGLRNDEIRKIAQDAFVKIGKSLQIRRKTDLYETALHFAGTSNDPADNDPILYAKLTENQKFHAKITTIIDQFAAEQETIATEHKDKLVTKKTIPKNSSNDTNKEDGNSLPESVNNKFSKQCNDITTEKLKKFFPTNGDDAMSYDENAQTRITKDVTDINEDNYNRIRKISVGEIQNANNNNEIKNKSETIRTNSQGDVNIINENTAEVNRIDSPLLVEMFRQSSEERVMQHNSTDDEIEKNCESVKFVTTNFNSKTAAIEKYDPDNTTLSSSSAFTTLSKLNSKKPDRVLAEIVISDEEDVL